MIIKIVPKSGEGMSGYARHIIERFDCLVVDENDAAKNKRPK